MWRNFSQSMEVVYVTPFGGFFRVVGSEFASAAVAFVASFCLAGSFFSLVLAVWFFFILPFRN